MASVSGTVIYGDITPRTAAFLVKDLLKRGFPYLCFEKFGQAKPIPKNSTKTIKFRRYFLKDTTLTTFTPADYFVTDNFDPTTKQLTEGVTPDATALDKQDIDAVLTQLGDRTEISDVVMDTHEDPILREAIDILGEQAAVIIEKSRFNILRAGTNVAYAAAVASRDLVNSVFTAAVQRSATRTLKRQLAKAITSIVKSNPSYGTESIAPSFIGICHPDLEYDIRKVASFVPAEKYGTVKPFENEIGKISDVRYILTTICEPWTAAGECGAAGGADVLENGAGEAHVYPILYLARDAYGLVPLKGKSSITPMVVNPKPSDSDPIAQRGHVSWKAMNSTIILNDFWMVRGEVACTDDDHLSD